MFERMRKQNKKNFDDSHNIKNKKIVIDDSIFLHDTQHKDNRNSKIKMKNRWRRFFKIKEIIFDKKTYVFKELNDA